MPRSAILAAICLATLSGCGNSGDDTSGPGDAAISSQESAARRQGDREAQVAVSAVQAQTLEARVARLEAEVDALQAEAATAAGLKQALDHMGSAAAMPVTPPADAPIAAPAVFAQPPAARSAPVAPRPAAAPHTAPAASTVATSPIRRAAIMPRPQPQPTSGDAVRAPPPALAYGNIQ